MKIRNALGLFLLVLVSIPIQAQTDPDKPADKTGKTDASPNFVANFLNRYRPPVESAEAAPPANPPVSMAQFLQTGVMPITLNDVVNMMLDQNLDLQSDRFTPRSNALETLVFYKILQPSLSFTGSLTRNSAFSTSQLNGATALSQLQHNFSVGYAKNLAAGTTVGVTATMARTSSNSSLSTFNPSYSGKVTYSISQHLLQNRGRNVNMRQIFEAQNNEKMSEAQFEVQLASLLVTAQKAYWDLVFSEGDLRVKQNSLDLAKQTLEENKQKVEIGTMARIDVIQTQLDVANRNDIVVGSTSTLTQAQDQVKKLISNSNDPSLFLIGLKPQDSPRPPNPADIPTLQEAVMSALENRPEIRQATLDLKNKDIDVQYTKNQKMPVFDVNASYNQNGTGGTQRVLGSTFGTGAVQQVIPGGVFDAFDQLFGYKYTGYSVGFSLVIPLGNKAADADFSRAINERKLSSSKIDATTQGIELEVRNALTVLQVAAARVETARVTLDLARQTLEAEKSKFDLGTSILRFVLDDQDIVATDESAELQAEVNYAKALIDLDHAMGVSLKKNNIRLDKALDKVPTNLRAD